MRYVLIDEFDVLRNIIMWNGIEPYSIPVGWSIRAATDEDVL